jgi:hypothetical protein
MLIRNLRTAVATTDLVGELVMCTADEAEALLGRGETDAVILLPEDLLDTLVYGGHTTVTVKAADPLIGATVYSVTDHAIETLDEVQDYALVYAEATQGHFDTLEERYEAISAFNMTLLSEVLTRMNSVDAPSTVSPYYAQALTLLLFVAVSIASFYVAVVSARQYGAGYVRHLYTRGVRFRHLFAAQLLLAASIALVLGCVLAAVLSFVGEGLSVWALLVSCVLLSPVLTSWYLMFSGFRSQPQAASTRTLIGCLALMFFLLFAGGSFYPTGLVRSELRIFNPVWLADQLAVWTLGDPLDLLRVALFIVPLTLAGAVGYFEWRRSL